MRERPSHLCGSGFGRGLLCGGQYRGDGGEEVREEALKGALKSTEECTRVTAASRAVHARGRRGPW